MHNLMKFCATSVAVAALAALAGSAASAGEAPISSIPSDGGFSLLGTKAAPTTDSSSRAVVFAAFAHPAQLKRLGHRTLRASGK